MKILAQIPKTLFELSGVEKPKIKLENSIIVVIDAQREYLDGRLPLPEISKSIEVIKTLLSSARKENVPIIHVFHKGEPESLFSYESVAFQPIPGLEPQPAEKIVLKELPDAFARTSLNKDLELYGKEKTLILVGFMTHMCVLNTAVTALDLGYQTVVIKDAVATRNLRGADGETIPAKQVNQTILATLQDRMAWVIPSKELL